MISTVLCRTPAHQERTTYNWLQSVECHKQVIPQLRSEGIFPESLNTLVREQAQELMKKGKSASALTSMHRE